MRQAKIAEETATGNMRTVREQVIGHFATINRKFQAGWNGDSLLHIVSREGYWKCAEFMSNPKNYSMFDTTQLDYNNENGKWRTPLHVAFTPPHETFCARKFGMDYEEGRNLPLSEKPEGIQVDSDWIKPGSAQERQELIQLLVDQGANVNLLDFHDYSPLHYACIWGWLETVKLFLEESADISQTNVMGQNALMVATEYGHLEIVEFLLEETDISIEAKNVDGETALFYPIRTVNAPMVKLLCEFGANVNAASYVKDTPLKGACRANNVEIVNVLLDWRATRRPSAFDLLKGSSKVEIEHRLEIERKEKQAEAEAAQKAQGSKRGGGGNAKFKTSKSEFGEWRPYLDKRKRGIFYYNRVSRVSQFEIPEDYVKDKTYIMKDATYGMHFYH